MLIVSLIATFGRSQLLSNALACFESQDYSERRCLALDDSGFVGEAAGDRWILQATGERHSSLPEKYNAMLAESLRRWPGAEAVAIQDDDDLFGPQWLSGHAAALENCNWSHPREVWSLHSPPASASGPGRELSAGRFWSAAAVRVSLLRRCGGFVGDSRATFDQENLAAWQAYGGSPGRPDDFAAPQFCYGWGRSNHCSARMGSPDWYSGHRMMDSGQVGKIGPSMDDTTRLFYEQLASLERK